MNKFIFASDSPRRKKIVQKLEYKFDFYSHRFNEKNSLSLDPKQIAEYNALNKARSISKDFLNSFIFAADTVIDFQSEVILKPKNNKDALRILSKLKNGFHFVITSIAVVRNNETTFLVSKKSLVKTNDVSTDKILKYIDTGYYLDKAGGYGIQNKNFEFIEKFYGCYENILGLPTCLMIACINKINEDKVSKFSCCVRDNK